MRLVDRGFALVALVAITNVTSFVAPILGLSIGAMTGLVLAGVLLYLGYRAPVVLRVLRERQTRGWLIVLVVWPLLTVLYAPVLSARYVGLAFLYGALLLAGAVFATMAGWPAVRRLAAAALAVTALGLVVSWIVPEAFTAVAELAEAQTANYGQRAFGFYLQPNMAAENMLFLSVVWLGRGRPESMPVTLARLAVVLTLLATTGSRGGFAGGLILATVVMLDRGWRQRAGRVRLSPTLRLIRTTAVLLLLGGLVVGGAAAAGRRFEDTAVGRGFQRITGGAGQVPLGAADGSLAERLVALGQYAARIQSAPLLGYGLGSGDYHRRTGSLFNRSHNAFVEAAFHYGIPYVVVLGLLMVGLLRHRRRDDVEAGLGGNIIAQVVVVLLASGLVSNTVFESRSLLLLLGCVLAQLRLHGTPAVAPWPGRRVEPGPTHA